LSGKTLSSIIVQRSFKLSRAEKEYRLRPVFLKVGGIAPLGAILMGKGAIGGQKNTKGAKMLNH